jgi:hypothetical protein
MKLTVCLFFLLLCAPLLAGPGIGQPAPDFTCPDTGYVYHTLTDYQYNVVWLNFGQSG